MSIALEKIRAKTKILHSELDKIEIFRKINSPELDIKIYSDFLKILYQFYSTIEPICFKILTESHPCSGLLRKRASLLEKDILNLNEKLPQSVSFDMPREIPMHYLVGMIYAIEGSALGGQQILQNARRSLDGKIELCVNYLTTILPMPHWKKVLDFINIELDSEQKIDEAILGANFVFSNLAEIAKKV